MLSNTTLQRDETTTYLFCIFLLLHLLLGENIESKLFSKEKGFEYLNKIYS